MYRGIHMTKPLHPCFVIFIIFFFISFILMIGITSWGGRPKIFDYTTFVLIIIIIGFVLEYAFGEVDDD